MAHLFLDGIEGPEDVSGGRRIDDAQHAVVRVDRLAHRVVIRDLDVLAGAAPVVGPGVIL
jgi:hypothetical protein